MSCISTSFHFYPSLPLSSQSRASWSSYYAGTLGIMFVVDGNDPDRLVASHDVLHKVLKDGYDALSEAALLVFANKLGKRGEGRNEERRKREKERSKRRGKDAR